MPSKLTLPVLLIAALLNGCTSLEASLSGPDTFTVKPGERTLAMKVEDASIENTAEVNIAKADPHFYDAHVNATSFYGAVLLTGQVPTQALKDKAESVTKDIAEVKQVHNELTVGNASYYRERASDSLISTRIASALLFDKTFPSARTKVTTCAGVVYLMGKLSHAEADHAIKLMSDVSGVEKIVLLVDYLDQPAATATSGSQGS